MWVSKTRGQKSRGIAAALTHTSLLLPSLFAAPAFSPVTLHLISHPHFTTQTLGSHPILSSPSLDPACHHTPSDSRLTTHFPWHHAFSLPRNPPQPKPSVPHYPPCHLNPAATQSPMAIQLLCCNPLHPFLPSPRHNFSTPLRLSAAPIFRVVCVLRRANSHLTSLSSLQFVVTSMVSSLT